MCNIMAAVGGIALLALMGGRGKGGKEPTPAPVLPRIKTNYSSNAQDQANTNQGLADDAMSSPATSSKVVSGKKASPGGSGYRNPLSIPTGGNMTSPSLPTIGGLRASKGPVNY